MIEKSDPVAEVASTSSDPLLPEDVPLVKDARGEGPAEVTWDHPNHGVLTTEPLCDVCNGKMSLEEFVSAKVNREGGGSGKKKKSGHRDRDRQRHSSSKSHSSRDKSYSSSSKDKSHSSSNKDKSRSSKSHSSSSRDKKHSSSSKDESQSSSGKDRSHSSSSKSHGSSSKDKSHSSSSRDKSQSSSSKDKSHSSSSKHRRHSSSKDLGTSSTAAALAEAEKADLQARINKATAAIEAAKRSGSELLGLADTASSSLEDEAVLAGPRSPELELDLPDMEEVVEVEGRRHSSGADGEVSSTVTIATPEQGEVETSNQEPSVWEGQVIMQDVAKFSVSAYQVSGTSDYLRVDLKSSLTLVGRIPPSVCWDYIDKISKNPTKEILVLRLGPSNNDEKEAYQAFFQYLSSRDR